MLFSYNNTTCEGFVPSIAPLWLVNCNESKCTTCMPKVRHNVQLELIFNGMSLLEYTCNCILSFLFPFFLLHWYGFTGIAHLRSNWVACGLWVWQPHFSHTTKSKREVKTEPMHPCIRNQENLWGSKRVFFWEITVSLETTQAKQESGSAANL